MRFTGFLLAAACAANISFAQDNLTRPQKVALLKSDLAYNISPDNTGYRAWKEKQISPYSIDAFRTAYMRFNPGSAEMPNMGRVYPSPRADRVAEAVQNIRDLAAVAWPEQLKVILVPLLHNPYIHERIFIEAELQLARAAIKTNDEKLSSAMQNELKYLYQYPRTLVQGLDAENNQVLRAEIGNMLASLGTPQSKTPKQMMDKARRTEITDKVLTAANYLFMGYCIAGSVCMPEAPVTTSFTPAPVSAKIIPLNSPRPVIYGNTALKIMPEPAPVINVRPVTNSMPVIAPVQNIAPVLSRRPQVNPVIIPQAAAVPAQDAQPVYIGEPVKKLTKEERDAKRAQEIEIALGNSNLLAPPITLEEIWRLNISWQQKMKLISQYHNSEWNNSVAAAKYDFTDAEQVGTKPVWALKNADDKITHYLKFSEDEEIEILEKINKLALEKNYKNIIIKIPQLTGIKLEDLPQKIQQKIKTEYEKLSNLSFYIHFADLDSYTPFIMTAVDTNGYAVGDPQSVSSATEFKKHPITQEQWQELVDFFRQLNLCGIDHCDLKFNMFFSKDAEGRLVITIIDFEPAGKLKGNNVDMGMLKDIEKTLLSKGFKVEGKTNYYAPTNLSKSQLLSQTKVSILWFDENNVLRQTSSGTVLYVKGKKVITSTERSPNRKYHPVVKIHNGRMAEAQYNYNKDGDLIFNVEDEKYFLEDIIPLNPDK